jgi:8-oxo-dGTP diphosphatase
MSHDRDFPGLPSVPGASPTRRPQLAVAVVWRGPGVLLLQRPDRDSRPPEWEFPSAPIPLGESPETAIRRELHEELGVDAASVEPAGVEIQEDLPGAQVEVHFLRCELASFDFKPSAGTQTWRWAKPEEIELVEVTPAIRGFLAGLGARC